MTTIEALFRKHVERNRQAKSIQGYFLRALDEREMYAKKREAKGQRSLFGDEDDVVESQIIPIAKKVIQETISTRTVKVPHQGRKVVEKRVLKPTEHWITLHNRGGGGGSRVIVNSQGEITGGHSSLVGKKLSDLFKKKPEKTDEQKIEVEEPKIAVLGDKGLTREERRQRWINAGKSEQDAEWMSKMSWQFLTPEEQALFNQTKGDDHGEKLLETDVRSDEGESESRVDRTPTGRSGDSAAGETEGTDDERRLGELPESPSLVSPTGDAVDVGLGNGAAASDGTGDAGSPATSAVGRGSDGGVGIGGSDSGHRGGDGAVTRSLSEPATPENPTDVSGNNWRYQTRDFFSSGVKAKFNANLEAMQTMREIAEEGRETATPEEQEKLSKFVGWGSMPGLFNEFWTQARDVGLSYEEFSKNKDKWDEERKLIQPLMSEDEWEAARKATLNSHFTHPDVVDAHWKMAQKMGFKGGRFLEPSAGIGYYVGMIPGELAKKTRVSAVELDPTTGNMLKMLYPAANVQVKGFQEHDVPNGFYDLVASNVPFGDYTVHDKKYNKHKAQIHDYFFLKSADLTKPGGMVMHVTSTGTMDKKDDKIRQELAKTCDFIGAVRFPGGTHQANAGTQVVTDMILLRKRHPGEKPVTLDYTPPDADPDEPGFTGTTTDSLGRVYHWVDGKRVPGPEWMGTKEVPDPAGGEPIVVNEYFADRPEQILGTLDRTGSMYRGESVNVTKTDDYEDRLQTAIDNLPEGVFTTGVGPVKDVPESIVAGDDVKDGGYVIRKGKLYRREGSSEVPQSVSASALARISGQLAIRDAKQAVVDAELSGESAGEQRAELNRAYDNYVKLLGPLSSKENKKAMADDPDAPNLLALEQWNPATKKAAKADMFTKSTISPHKMVEHAENVAEGVGVSLNETGGVDPSRIAELTGRPRSEVEKELVSSGLAFEDPQGGWVPADQYLSGNVRQKLVLARAAAEADPRYQQNLEALEKVQPEDIDYQDIDVKLGASWVPPSDIKQFAADMGGVRPEDFTVEYIPQTGEWQFSWYRKRSTAAIQQLGTKRRTFDDLMEALMNGRSVAVYDTEDDGSRTFNEDETHAAQEKVAEIKDKFGEWVWNDDDRRERLHRLYNDNFNNIRPLKYDGSHLTFPGMNLKYADRDIRKNFAWQVVTTGRGLAAHEVGLGKSGTMFAAAMELRRLGLAKKPCLVVLKSTIEQITKEALEVYPGAKIISTAGRFDAKDRKRTIAQIATGDYDMVIMTHDHMDLMGMRPEVVQGYIRDELESLREAKEAAWQDDQSKNNRVVKALENAMAKLEAKLKDAIDEEGKDDALHFEETGIDQLFIDECFPGSTIVRTDRGDLTIAQIVNGRMNVRVASINRGSGDVEWRAVTEWYARPLKNSLVRVSHEYGDFICTPNHNIWTITNGYVCAGELSPVHALRLSSDSISKVTGVAVHQKQGDDRAIDGNVGDSVVYDIEVDEHHNYFADGVNVSNSHRYKSLPVISRGERIKGVPQGRSDRATNMLMRTRWLMEHNGGRGVVFATGTPVANTMAELYNIQRYLQPDELKERGIANFDAWANAFGDRQTQMEATVTGQYAPVTRFSKFVNIPELMHIASQVMDVQRGKDLKNPDGTPVIVRPKRADHIETTPNNDETRRMMADLQKRSQQVKGKKPEKGADNMAVICSDGRKGSLDMRMLYADAPDDPTSKLNQCVDTVLKLHKKRPDTTQLIFSNVGVNPSEQTGFHLYGDLIEKLVDGGIPRERIADFSKLEGVKKDAAQEAMRRGDVIVGIGSTEKLGTGVNVQNRVAAMHHLDVPWQPAEIEQRDGRGYRAGNRNDPSKAANDQKVDIHRYVSEGSLDTFMWQVVGNKAHFINQIINGKDKTTRTVSDDDTETLTPEQLMAVASGDPRVLRKVQLESDIRDLKRGSERHHRDQSKIRDQLRHHEEKYLPDAEKTAKRHEQDVEHIAKLPAKADFSMKIGGKHYSDRKLASDAFDERFAEISDTPRWRRSDIPSEIGEYKGFKVHVPVDAAATWGMNGLESNQVHLEGPSGHKYPARASLASMDAVIRGIPNVHKTMTAHVAQLKKDMETFRENSGKEYRRAPEYIEKQKELQALNKELSKRVDQPVVEHIESEAEEPEVAVKYSMALATDRMILRFQADAAEVLTERYSKSQSAEEPKKEHEFSSTQIDVPKRLSIKLAGMAARIPDEDLAEDGREDHFHITLKYGIHSNDPESVRSVIEGYSPFPIVLGKTSLLENPDADVVKIEIPPQRDVMNLFNLNHQINESTECTTTHPEYKAHITLAYVKPGLGKKYLGLKGVEGEKFMANTVMFSNKKRELTPIKIGSERSIDERIDYAKRKAAVGQKSMFDEDLHPRNDIGRFAEKDELSSVSTIVDTPFVPPKTWSDSDRRKAARLITSATKALKDPHGFGRGHVPIHERSTAEKALFAAKDVREFGYDMQNRYGDDGGLANVGRSLFAESQSELDRIGERKAAKANETPERKKNDFDDELQVMIATNKAISESATQRERNQAVPPAQHGLFSHEDLTGQKSLFDVGTPTLKAKKSAPDKRFELGPSIPEKFEADQKANKIEPLEKQKNLFSRIESAEIACKSKGQ